MLGKELKSLSLCSFCKCTDIKSPFHVIQLTVWFGHVICSANSRAENEAGHKLDYICLTEIVTFGTTGRRKSKREKGKLKLYY